MTDFATMRGFSMLDVRDGSGAAVAVLREIGPLSVPGADVVRCRVTHDAARSIDEVKGRRTRLVSKPPAPPRPETQAEIKLRLSIERGVALGRGQQGGTKSRDDGGGPSIAGEPGSGWHSPEEAAAAGYF